MVNESMKPEEYHPKLTNDAYRLGWNANNCGKNILSNPFSSVFATFLYYEWQRGFNENQKYWDSPDLVTPQPFEGVKSVEEICKEFVDIGRELGMTD